MGLDRRSTVIKSKDDENFDLEELKCQLFRPEDKWLHTLGKEKRTKMVKIFSYQGICNLLTVAERKRALFVYIYLFPRKNMVDGNTVFTFLYTSIIFTFAIVIGRRQKRSSIL